MHPSSRFDTLKVLVASEDRALQHQLSQFLHAVGYQAVQASESRLASAAFEAELPHVLLLDADMASRNDWELSRRFAAASSRPGAFQFLLAEEPDEAQLVEAFEAGIDDVLPKPIDFGELLTRLRAAARVLEFDRRTQEQAPADRQTGLDSRTTLVRRLTAEWVQHPGTTPRVSCVAMEIDFFRHVTTTHGTAAGNTLLLAVAKEWTKLAGQAVSVAYWGGERFCAVLPGATEAAAGEWAEHAYKTLAAAKFKLAEGTFNISVSLGVAGSHAGDTPEQLVDRAIEALERAQASGRNCAVRYGDPTHAPDEFQGRLFERTVARDVMTPCSIFLQPNEPLGEAIELLARTRMESVVVVDVDGTLLGVCDQEQVAAAPQGEVEHKTVREVLNADVQSFDEEESLTSLLEFFTRDPRPLVVVVRDAKPVGYIAISSVATLSQPVTIGSLAAKGRIVDSSDYLLVPDLCPEDGGHTT